MKLYLQYFDKLGLQVEQQEYIDLEKLLGKQLTLVFSLLVANKQKGVAKSRLIDAFWKNSENPSNALKFSIHRLRNILKTLDGFKDIDIIETTKTGYKISDGIDLCLDYEEFERLGNRAMNSDDIQCYENTLKLYRGNFLSSFNEGDILFQQRAHYKVFLARVVFCYCQVLEKLRQWQKMEDVCLNVLQFDPLNEEILYYTIKSLLKLHKNDEAKNYYESTNQLMINHLGVELQSKIAQLIYGSDFKEDTTQKKILMDSNGDPIKGPLYCEYACFQKIVQFEIRNSIRLHNRKYLLFVNFDEQDNRDNDMLGLTRTVAHSLKINDVYTRMSNNQIAILCFLFNKSEGYMIAERIISAYKHKISNRATLNYQLIELSADVINEEIANLGRQ